MNSSKFSRAFLGIFAGTALALVSSIGASPSAVADDGQVAVSQPQYSRASSSATLESSALVQEQSKIELEFNMKSGIKQTSKESKNKGCKLVSSEKKVPKGAKCVRLKKGAWFTNSGRTRSDTTYKYRDQVKTPWLKFVKRGSQWYKAGYTRKGKTVENCGNKSWFKGSKPKTTYKQITLVTVFKEIEVDVKIKIAESGKVTAVAAVSCPGGSGASATASASASYAIEVINRIKVIYMTEIKVKGPASITIKQKADVSAEVQIKAIAIIKAEASAWCKDSTPPPPPVEKPLLIDFTQINDVDMKDETRMCATVSLPGSNSGTLTFTARFGVVSPATFDVTGQVAKCAIYKAPTEVPSGGTDTITVTVRDAKTGLSATDSTIFKINAVPLPPA